MLSALTTYLEAHVLTIAAAVAWLVMLARISGSGRTSQSTLAWLLGFAFVPLVSIPLYLALGSRKFPRRAKGPKLDVPPPRPGHTFELLTSGESAYTRLLGLIRSAKRTIDLTMFIVGEDATGRALVDALVESAMQGVEVRVVLDAVGCARSFRRVTRALAAGGGEVRAFMPLRHSPVRGRTNLRSHRKIAIIDGECVFAGGMNLANEYMGPAPAPPGSPRWRDLAAVVAGPSVADAMALFESDWAFCGGSKRSPQPGVPSGGENRRGDAVAQFVPSGPDMLTDTMYDLLLTWIYNAHERIAIVTPYYVPDDALQHALVLAARRGVKTELLVPSRSNHRVADIARRKLLRELSANRVDVHYYGRGMVHAKAVVVDDACAYVGSPNFDMRSLFLNYEDAICVYSPGAIAEVRAFVDGLIAECGPAPRIRERRIVEQIALLLAPEL
jgi:cardiolipin synthase A/B